MAANVNRPVEGQIKCYTQDCSETATVHKIAKGSRTGEYYLRCPVCKCNQSSGPHLQKYIRKNMKARPGHEIPAAENDDEAIGQEPDIAEPIGQNDTTEHKRGGVITGLLVVLALAAFAAGLSGVKTK